MYIKDFLSILIFSLISYGLCKFLIPTLRKYFLSNPTSRDSHFEPKPTGGGITFILISYFIILLNYKNISINNIYIILISTPLAIVGLLDDKYNLSKLIRYTIHVLTSILFLNIFSIDQKLFTNNNISSDLLSILIYLILVISFTAIINFINFMDGIDGLVASIFIVVFAYASLTINPIFFSFIGILLGFLFLNWNPAKLFMGDVGSTFLGSIFIGLLVSSSSINRSLNILLIAFPLLADAFLCVPRRYKVGQNIFEPHKEHLYQRLTLSGWGHGKVVKLYIIGSLVIFLTSFLENHYLTVLIILFEILMGYFLDQYVAVPFGRKSKNEMSNL